MILGLSCCLLLSICFASNSSDKTVIHEEVTLVRNELIRDQVYLNGSIELGELECNKVYLLVLDIKNGSDVALKFDKGETGCACRSFVIDKSTILPGETVEAFLEFKTPDSCSTDQYYVGARFKLSGKEVGVLSCRGTLAGNVYIADKQVFLEFDSTKKKIVPIVCTPPANFRGATVNVDENLKSSLRVTKIVQKKESEYAGGSLRFEVRSNAQIPKGSSSQIGKVEIVFPEIKKAAEISVVVQKRLPVSIHPSHLFLSKDKNDVDFLTTTVMLRITNPKNYVVKKGQVKISAKIGEIPAKLEVKPLTDLIYRVTIQIAKDALDDQGEKRVTWRVKHGSVAFSFETSLSIR